MAESVGDQLRAAIRAAPEDRALRLVYADWLIERGDLRGEWIVLSCGEATEDDDCEMRRRALWQAHRERWTRDDVGDIELAKRSLAYRDGFLHAATFWLGQALAVAPVLARHPIDSLTLTDTDGNLRKLARSPLLETVRRLEISPDGETSRDELVGFLNAPGLGRLEELALVSHWKDSDDAIWSALARYGRLAELKGLSLTATAVTADQARWLGRSLPALERLTIEHISGDALDALAETATFRLRELTLGGSSDPNDAAFAEALESPLMHELTSLTLRRCLRKRGAARLSRLPCAATLTQLSLESHQDAAVVQALGECAFPALRQLSIEDNRATDDLIGVVARFPALTALHAGSNRLTWRSAERILALSALRTLLLPRNKLGNRGALAIAQSARAPLLRHLDLDGNDLDNGAIYGFVDAGRLNDLRSLSVHSNDLGDLGGRLLAEGPFDRMARLSLRPTSYTARLFEEGWLPVGITGSEYERKLEPSGRAVPRRRRQR